jgi:excisionase family DNA binding protein
MDTISDRIISAPINEFCSLSGLGRTKVYEMLDSGDLDSIKIGKRRLILIDSYRKLIERQRAGTTSPSKAGPTISAAMG